MISRPTLMTGTFALQSLWNEHSVIFLAQIMMGCSNTVTASSNSKVTMKLDFSWGNQQIVTKRERSGK